MSARIAAGVAMLAVLGLAAACASAPSPVPAAPAAAPVATPPANATLAGPTDAALDARSRALADRFQQQLLAALTAALAAGGPAAAIDACAVTAPALAATLSAESGATVRRTALRARNPRAVPDAAERAALEQLRAAPVTADGRPAERSGWLAGSGGGNASARDYRYLRAIPTAAPCLACHGTAIAPEVAAAIARRYPQDAATGFAAGELRGAFSITWPAAGSAAR